MAADGQTYERVAIERFLATGKIGMSPVTKLKLTSTQLYPNNSLKQALEWVQSYHQAPKELA